MYETPGQGIDWEPWREALDPVLQQHGFSSLSREHRSGGVHFLRSRGLHGARLMLESWGKIRITEIRVDADPCEDATLGL